MLVLQNDFISSGELFLLSNEARDREREKMRKEAKQCYCVLQLERQETQISAEGTGIKATGTSKPLGHHQLVLFIQQFGVYLVSSSAS